MKSLFRRATQSSRRFVPIEILPFTWRQRRRLIKTAAAPEQAYGFPFNLSSSPPAKWSEFFQTAFYQQQGGGDIPRVEGRTLTATSTTAELQNTLSILKLAVASANEKYGALVNRQLDAEETGRATKEDARSRAEREMGDALDRLKF